MTEALQERLSGRLAASGRDHAPWMKGFGQLRLLHRETARIQRVIDREFEVVEPGPPVILDTNALSAFIDGEPAVGVRLSAESQVAIWSSCLGEFRYGISGSRYRDKTERRWPDHLAHFEILSVTESTTLTYARVRAWLKKLVVPFRRTTRGSPPSRSSIVCPS